MVVAMIAYLRMRLHAHSLKLEINKFRKATVLTKNKDKQYNLTVPFITLNSFEKTFLYVKILMMV